MGRGAATESRVAAAASRHQSSVQGGQRQHTSPTASAVQIAPWHDRTCPSASGVSSASCRLGCAGGSSPPLLLAPLLLLPPGSWVTPATRRANPNCRGWIDIEKAEMGSV